MDDKNTTENMTKAKTATKTATNTVVLGAVGSFVAMIAGMVAYAAALLVALGISNRDACGESAFSTRPGVDGGVTVSTWGEARVTTLRIGDLVGSNSLLSLPSPRISVECAVYSAGGESIEMAIVPAKTGGMVSLISVVSMTVVAVALLIAFKILCHSVWQNIWRKSMQSDSRIHGFTVICHGCHCVFFAVISILMLMTFSAYCNAIQTDDHCLTAWQGETIIDKESSPVVSNSAEKTAVLRALNDAVGASSATGAENDTEDQAQRLGSQYIRKQVNAAGDVQCVYGPGPGAATAVTWPMYDQRSAVGDSVAVICLIGTGLMLSIMIADCILSLSRSSQRRLPVDTVVSAGQNRAYD